MTGRIASLAFALVLAACATPAPPPAPPPELTGVPKAFEMNARISIRVADRSDIARLRWVRRRGSDEWVFSSPIGTEVARIESNARGATLFRGGLEPETAESFEALTEHALGVGLDPAQLSAWLHGQPGRTGLPAEWKVSVEEKQQAGAVELAKRITASRGDVVVKLVVDSYRPLEE
jgi:outer membrane biogenesis lipoprotein LolB